MLGKLVFLITIGACLCGCPYNCNKKPKQELCTTDGTYRNPCLYLRAHCLNKSSDVEILYNGPCANFAASIPAPRVQQPRIVYRPVNCKYCSKKTSWKCGNDLQNYRNTCAMCKTGKKLLNIRHDGKCTDYELALRGASYPERKRQTPTEIAPLSLPRKPGCPKATFYPCPRTYGSFVCGSNKRTYASECEMCRTLGPKTKVTVTKVGGIC